MFEAVNNVFAIYNNSNFGHVTNAEPMEQFWAPAILITGYCSVSDPKAHYDNVTRKWYVTEVAYGPPGCRRLGCLHRREHDVRPVVHLQHLRDGHVLRRSDV